MLRRHAFLALAAGIGCNRPDAALSVADVLADPGRYDEQLLEFKGEATDATGLFSVGVYEFSDGSGAISVVTSRGLPAVGSHFVMRGRVSAGATVGGRRFGVAIFEEERIYPTE